MKKEIWKDALNNLTKYYNIYTLEANV